MFLTDDTRQAQGFKIRKPNESILEVPNSHKATIDYDVFRKRARELRSEVAWQLIRKLFGH
jgi:hypothetical protein